MNKTDIIWIIVNLFFLALFIYSGIESYKLSKNERNQLKFYRKTLNMKEDDINDFFPPSLEKSIINLSKSLMITSILSASIISGNIIYIIIKLL